MHELALMVDDYFGINLSDDDIARCVEIGDLAEIVEKEVRFKSDYE
jgi:acyl carrier protein